MIGSESDHCRIVQESMSGKRRVDEQTHVSLAVLSERLERLKQHGEAFGGVAFSSEAEALAARRSEVGVG